MDFREVTFDQLEKACAGLLTTNIKGKEYVQVNERVKAFRKVYPTGYIITDAPKLDNAGFCLIRAEVGFYTYEDKDGFIEPVKHPLATGTAYEVQSSSYINKTSYIENCETSAIGRALGFAGFGLDVAIASAEEVTNAIEQQAKIETISEREAELLRQVLEDSNVNIAALCKQYKVKKLTDLNAEQYAKIHQDVATWRETQNAQP